MFAYDFCEDKTPPRIFVLGMAASGKSTFINLAKENWEKYTDTEEGQSSCPEFIEVNGFDLDLDFKDEFDNYVVSEFILCHDITIPFSDEEKNAIKKIKEMLNGNEQIGLLLILTKSDLITLGADEQKSMRNEFSEKYDVVTSLVTEKDISENSQIANIARTMGLSFQLRALRQNMELASKVTEKLGDIIEDYENSEQRIRIRETLLQLNEQERKEFIANAFMAWAQDEEERAEKLPKIFADTLTQCTENPVLADAIKNSLERQTILFENEPVPKLVMPRIPVCITKCARSAPRGARVFVSKNRTFQAASKYKKGAVCILNFANSFTPGGCVRMGTGTQEEALCRCSTLYPCISEKSVIEKFYTAHYNALKSREMTELANDDIIYTPDVIVFKSDTMLPELLPENEWFKTDVITCAAPNLSGIENYAISEKEFRLIHYCRGKRIFELAKAAGVEHLVLGAFGCGAFHNPPDIVADVYKKLVDEFSQDFMSIEFAIYSTNGFNTPPLGAKIIIKIITLNTIGPQLEIKIN